MPKQISCQPVTHYFIGIKSVFLKQLRPVILVVRIRKRESNTTKLRWGHNRRHAQNHELILSLRDKELFKNFESHPRGVLLLGDYSDDDEQEADWLAAAYLLPRSGLIHYRSLEKSPAEIARH